MGISWNKRHFKDQRVKNPPLDAHRTATRQTASPAAAERMRRHRERRRDGLRCLLIELRDTEIDALIHKGTLKADARNDPDAILNALYAHLDRTLDAIP